jgi:hypothetical protein
MGSGIQGKYFSFSASSVDAGTDLITSAQTLTGISKIVAKKITLISTGSLALDINNLGVDSSLYQDSDLLYKLSLDSYDCTINSLKVNVTTACPVFLAMVF